MGTRYVKNKENKKVYFLKSPIKKIFKTNNFFILNNALKMIKKSGFLK